MFVDISGKRAVIVGGGKVAVRRARVLLDFGAEVTLIANSLTDTTLSDRVNFINRSFRSEDIEDCFMVIAATDNRAVNHEIYELCTEKNIPVSVADMPSECSFYFPAVCMNDDICVGVVSDGSRHELVRETAKKIRSEIL
jgi:siroheme synthase-like protein